MATIAEILKSKISKGSKSKAYVASQLDVTEKTIENYMNGKREPDASTLVKLSQLLDFSLNDLSEQSVPGGNFEIPKKTKPVSDNFTEALAIIKQQNEFLQRLMESNLAGLSQDLRELYNEQVKTRAELRGYEQRHIYKEVNWDKNQFLHAMAEVGKLIESNLIIEQQSDKLKDHS